MNRTCQLCRVDTKTTSLLTLINTGHVFCERKTFKKKVPVPEPLFQRTPNPVQCSPTGPQLSPYELMICPDQVSCFVPGLRCAIFTSTACTFRFLGGTRHTLYVTSSPSTGTYSPSMLKRRKFRTMKQN